MIAAGGVNPSIVRGFEIFGKIFRNEGPQFLKKKWRSDPYTPVSAENDLILGTEQTNLGNKM